MRFLELDSLLCMCPADKSVELSALNRVNLLLSRLGQNTDRLSALTERGDLKTAQVNIDGKPANVFWYRVEGERLIVDTIISIAPELNTIEQALSAMEIVAKQNFCVELEGATSRQGMVKQLNKAGWQPAGIIMRKYL